MFDYLVVGAGFAGSVCAERLASAGKNILLVDQRSHVGGNAYDHYNNDGILVHKFGPHCFHTNSQAVFEYLSRFTAWRPYEHRVLASVDGQLVPVPINLDTINALRGTTFDAREVKDYLDSVTEPLLVPHRTAETELLGRVGKELYDLFFRGYTRKQWGMDPSELDASVTARVPVRTNRDDRYFTDRYQHMPRDGYTKLFERMTTHPRIKILLQTSYREIAAIWPQAEVIYTGPFDEFFDYRFGRLPYRSATFQHETLDTERYQPVGVVNYPNTYDYTRVTEWKHLTGQRHPKTSIAYEYPQATGEPYHPVPCAANTALYQQYRQLAKDTSGVHFLGRLGSYSYFNMDAVVAQALKLVTTLLKKEEEQLCQA